jgi:hypothetical protein
VSPGARFSDSRGSTSRPNPRSPLGRRRHRCGRARLSAVVCKSARRRGPGVSRSRHRRYRTARSPTADVRPTVLSGCGIVIASVDVRRPLSVDGISPAGNDHRQTKLSCHITVLAAWQRRPPETVADHRRQPPAATSTSFCRSRAPAPPADVCNLRTRETQRFGAGGIRGFVGDVVVAKRQRIIGKRTEVRASCQQFESERK